MEQHIENALSQVYLDPKTVIARLEGNPLFDLETAHHIVDEMNQGRTRDEILASAKQTWEQFERRMIDADPGFSDAGHADGDTSLETILLGHTVHDAILENDPDAVTAVTTANDTWMREFAAYATYKMTTNLVNVMRAEQIAAARNA